MAPSSSSLTAALRRKVVQGCDSRVPDRREQILPVLFPRSHGAELFNTEDPASGVYDQKRIAA